MILWTLFWIVSVITVFKLLKMESDPSPRRKQKLFNSRMKSRGYK